MSGRPGKRAKKVSYNGSAITSYLVPSYLKAMFSRSVELIDLAVDGEVLYTLSFDGILSVYDVSSGTKCVGTANVKHDVQNMVFSLPPTDREFVSIHAVPAGSSGSVQLIVVTSFGERVYYSTRLSSARVGESAPQFHLRPRTLRFSSFRPSPYADARAVRPIIHIAWCGRGSSVMAELREAQSDKLVIVCPDATLASQTAGRNQYQTGAAKTVEVVYDVPLDESDEMLGYQASTSRNTPMSSGTNTGRRNGRAVARRQAMAFADADGPLADEDDGPLEPPSYFWVLTSNSLLLYERVQPLQRLKGILSSGGGAPEEIDAFFSRHGASEACAMCLEIAVSHPTLATAAATVFYRHGGEANADKGGGGYGNRSDPGSGQRSGGLGANGDMHSGFDPGRPSVHSLPLARFSGAHDGTAWYLSRVLHPLWTRYITSDQDPEAYQRLSARKEVIERVRDQLLALVSFLEKYPPDAMLPEAPGENGHGDGHMNGHGVRFEGEHRRRGSQQSQTPSSRRESDRSSQDGLFRGLYQLKKTGEARRAESSSILGLKNIAVRTVEALALLLILSDHQLHRLVVKMPMESRSMLSKMRLCDFVIGGEGSIVSASLIEAIFSSYPDGAAAFSTVGQILKERCSSYFGDSDVDLHRGLALLRKAVDTVSNAARDANGEIIIGEEYGTPGGMMDVNAPSGSVWTAALNLAEEAAQMIKGVAERVFDVAAICEDFKAVRAIPALVDVALTIGKVSEEQGNEERAKTAYDSALDALRPFVGNDVMVRSSNISHAQELLKEASMRVAMKSKSEVFLRRLYEFLLESEQGREEILKQSSPSVEKFLEEFGALDLLWRYCAKHERYAEAAGVLLNLSETETQKSLVDRLNYLSCALHNAKTATAKGDGRAAQLLTEISDFMDVAKVQLRVREELKKRHTGSEEVSEALTALDGEIMDLSTLFNEYARRFELHEASLEIFRCGGYRDEAYVRGLWAEIIEREAELCDTPTAIGEKIQTLGRELYPSEVVFPVGFITELLERLAFRNEGLVAWRDCADWVGATMKKVGVRAIDMIEVYRRMLESGQQLTRDGSFSWSDGNALTHITRTTGKVVEIWFAEVAGKRKVEIMSEGEMVGRTITLCKSRLRGSGMGIAAELAREFELLDTQISRLAHG